MHQIETSSNRLLEIHLGGMGSFGGKVGMLDPFGKPQEVDPLKNTHPVGKLLAHQLPYAIMHISDICNFILLEDSPTQYPDGYLKQRTAIKDGERVCYLSDDLVKQVEDFVDIDLDNLTLRRSFPIRTDATSVFQLDQVKRLGTATSTVGEMNFGDGKYYFWYSDDYREDIAMFDAWAHIIEKRFISEWQKGLTPPTSLELQRLTSVAKSFPTSIRGSLPFEVFELSRLQAVDPTELSRKLKNYDRYPWTLRTLVGLVPRYLEPFINLTTQALNKVDEQFLDDTFSKLAERVLWSDLAFHHARRALDGGRNNGEGRLDLYEVRELKKDTAKLALPDLVVLLDSLSENDSLERKKEVLARVQEQISEILVEGIL